MAEEKKEEKKSSDALNHLIQYPTRRHPAPSSVPKPINASIPPINAPNECLLAFNASDWEMFDQIHKKYGDALSCLYPDDTTRFVQGYSHEKDRAVETFKHIDELLKRGFSPQQNPNEYDFKQLLDSPMPANEEKESHKAWPVFIYGYDNEGHPIMYDEIGCSNPADLDTCFEHKMRKLKTFRFRVLRRLHNTKRIQTMRYSYDGSVNDKGGLNAITKHCIVMDIKNFYARCLTAKYRNLVRDIIGDESNLWPNTLEKMYIINAPWPFRFAWKIISNFVHPITVAKIDILGGDYINTLKKKIALDQIPKAYGGTCELPIKYGYTADIADDVLDGDYCTVADPVDLEIVPCVRNRNRARSKVKQCDDDRKEVEVEEKEEEEVERDAGKIEKDQDAADVGTNGSDDSYVKVKSGDKEKQDVNVKK